MSHSRDTFRGGWAGHFASWRRRCVSIVRELIEFLWRILVWPLWLAMVAPPTRMVFRHELAAGGHRDTSNCTSMDQTLLSSRWTVRQIETLDYIWTIDKSHHVVTPKWLRASSKRTQATSPSPLVRQYNGPNRPQCLSDFAHKYGS